MAEDVERHVLRATFDEAAEEYDRARRAPPSEVFDDVVELAELTEGSSLLEIGCGTGKATLPLAERGFSILAVELGDDMAEVARRNLAAYPKVKVVTSPFETWNPTDERFDAVVSFEAFHWLDPEIAFAKSSAVLRDGGALAVYGSRFAVHDGADPVWVATREDHAATGVAHERMYLPIDHIRDRSAEFTDDGHFAAVTVRRYRWSVQYEADSYVALLGTVSRYRVLEDDVRRDLFERIHQRISAAGGTISPTLIAVLYVAKRGRS